MTTNTEQQVLLAMSGELSPAQQEELEAKLRESNAATLYREQAERIMSDARQHLSDAAPAPESIANIIHQARTMRRGIIIPFPQPVVRAIAGAAALALFVTSWLALTSTTPTSSPVDDLHTIVAMVSEQDDFFQNNAELAERERMLALARQLLIMEGFTEETNGEEDEALLFEVLEPTSLQLNNTSASPQEIYG
ncbi:MAG: hypothetical protein ISS35_06355 [Kiritimatiellae bacterium]|nr:hypothetical protein [Kiritimatiellia bacterium]